MYYGAYLRFSHRNSSTSSKTFNYDAFISYSSDDDIFVTEEVVTGESGIKMKKRYFSSSEENSMMKLISFT